MIYVDPQDITIPQNRFREELDPQKLRELKDGIQRVGLISPPTCERSGDTWILRAGERRLRVLRELISEGVPFRCGREPAPGGLVPIIEWDSLSDLERVEIEVQENILRTDFNWKERNRAIETLHKYRQQQDPLHSVRDTAAEVARKPVAQGNEITEVSNALIINKHLDDPDVARAKDQKEALKIIKKKTDAIHHAQLAKHFNLNKTQHKLLLGDSLVLLSSLPAESFDVILTDPPYGVGAHGFGSMSATGHDYKDTETEFKRISSIFADESYRVAKKRAHAYVFCDIRRFEHLGALMVLAGWTVFPTPIYWYKRNGMVPFPKHGPRRTVECILYAWKGDRETLVLKNDCIVEIPAIRQELKHAAQKPVALYCELLSRSARPGDTVLDCFGGSGTILVAANIKLLTATYIENDEHQFNVATQRAHLKEIDDGAEEEDGIEISFDEQPAAAATG